MRYKQPRSVQVVVFGEDNAGPRFLLLKRVSRHGGFWQPVTGSLEDGETHSDAAAREVFEETGIANCDSELIDLGLTNTFEIAADWRAMYGPGVNANEEVCFALRCAVGEVRIDPAEHDDYGWFDYDTAIRMLYWESNRRAFAAVRGLLEAPAPPSGSRSRTGAGFEGGVSNNRQ